MINILTMTNQFHTNSSRRRAASADASLSTFRRRTPCSRAEWQSQREGGKWKNKFKTFERLRCEVECNKGEAGRAEINEECLFPSLALCEAFLLAYIAYFIVRINRDVCMGNVWCFKCTPRRRKAKQRYRRNEMHRAGAPFRSARLRTRARDAQSKESGSRERREAEGVALQFG